MVFKRAREHRDALAWPSADAAHQAYNLHDTQSFLCHAGAKGLRDEDDFSP